MRYFQYLVGIIFACIILGMILNAPVENMQKSYIKFVKDYRNAPQKRIDDTYKYVEMVENGEIESQNTAHNQQKYPYKNIINTTSSGGGGKYSKPLYVRDKNNPKILHKYGK